jgi:hypothetical protein
VSKTATPYTIELAYQTRSGKTGQLHLTASDVAAAFYLDPSGSSDLVISSEACRITRMLYSGTPATTTTATVWVNGANTGIVLVGASNTPTAVWPQINEKFYIQLDPGSKIKFVQV